jgi:hemerythrin
MAIMWTSDLNTGIGIIDEQHKSIADYINKMEVAIKHRDRAVIGQVLDELVDYTLSHFAFEESLQEEAGYKFSKPHKAVHDVLAKRVASYQQRHHAGEDIGDQLHAMLCTWLVHHIKRDDMAYVSEVKTSLLNIVEDRNDGGWLSRSLGRFFR